MNNTALVRIKKEYDLITKDPPENFIANPIKDDLFTWHFTIKGAEETEFENGLYHGVIKLPTSYPLKPPNIMFLNPNGRFDTNVDVCLSVTKYHREEWQAAWTIRTILEAIIAFFPIKEDHEAIGAIDYPIEARKKLAVQSRKWKCDICGPLIELLPDKEPRKASESNVIATSTVQLTSDKDSLKKDSEKEDNKSDNSNPLNDRDNQSEPKPIRSKSSRMKKIELDRKSHLSNVEGIIFEDVNEDLECEEEMEIHLKRYQTDLNIIDDSTARDNITSGSYERNLEKLTNKDIKTNLSHNATELKRSNSDTTNTHTDFGEYLRMIRQSQFEQSNQNKEENVNTNNLIDESNDEVEIQFKTKPNIQKEDTLNLNNTSEHYNTFKQLTNDELEFYDIITTVKLHKSKNTEDIIQEIYNDKLENLLNSTRDKSSILGEALNKYIEKELDKKLNEKKKTSNNQDKEITNQEKMKEVMNLFEGKEKLEDLMKQKTNALKYVTKKKYKEAKIKRLRILNVVMVLIILIIFIVYYQYRNYL